MEIKRARPRVVAEPLLSEGSLRARVGMAQVLKVRPSHGLHQNSLGGLLKGTFLRHAG